MFDENKAQGSLLGATLLIAGCCIGAGMLGMPLSTVKAGFAPTMITFLLSWLYMLVAGLVLLEVALRFPDETNMAEMARKYFGRLGEAVVFLLMLFLMYALMTAYSAVSGPLIAKYLPISADTGSTLFAAALFIALGLGTKALDYFNRLFMVGLVLSYLGLVFLGLPQIDIENLKGGSVEEAFYITPILIIAFGFHNLIPSLVRYLGRDVKRLRLSILLGSVIPLGIYLVWEIVILGLIEDKSSNLISVNELLEKAAHVSWITPLIALFAFFAITTSFMGNALSVLDFLSDQVGGKKTVLKRIVLTALTVIPPVVVAFYNPDIFLAALTFAGSFSAVLLFGVIPAMMSWKGKSESKVYQVKGGLLPLLFLVLFGFFVMGLSL